MGCMLLLLLPLGALLILALSQPIDAVMQHMLTHVLWDYLQGSMKLLFGTSMLAAVLGVLAAWLVVIYEMPARRWLARLLVLPLAIPAYVSAFTFTETLGEGRMLLQVFDHWGLILPPLDLRHTSGASFVLGLGLYPYVYLSCLVALTSSRSAAALDAARLMTSSHWLLFRHVGLPMMRIPLMIGVGLVMMEVLNDYGVASLYAVPTLTWAIVDAWTAMGSLDTALKLSLLLVCLVLPLVIIERRMRQHLPRESMRERTTKPLVCSLPLQWLFTGLLCLPILAGFVAPICTLVALGGYDRSWPLFTGLDHSFLLALFVALGVLVVATIVEFWRVNQLGWRQWPAYLSLSGYAVPAAAVGMGTLALSSYLSPMFSGLVGLCLALIFRFATLGAGQLGQVISGPLQRHHEQALLMGAGFGARLRHILWPMLSGPAGLAMILVAVDVIKELPATFLLRPFGFDTLATVTFQSASLENYEAAAGPALMMTALSLLAVTLVFPKLPKSEGK